jgi:DNA-binding protein YbaB
MTLPDESAYEELAQATTRALEEFGVAARRLAAAETAGRSPDGLVTVRVTATGEVRAVTLRRSALHRYSGGALARMIGETLRRTQLRAREAYERAVAEAVPPEVDEVERLLRETHRE